MEATAFHLRQRLHELRRMMPADWQTDFERVQAELLTVVTEMGQLTRRIIAMVEGTMGPVTEEDENDV